VQQTNHAHLLIIDRQDYWRDFSRYTLEAAGYTVGVLNTYETFSTMWVVQGRTPDLIILGCMQIGKEEEQFIQELIAHNYHLLVLCTSLAWEVMRTLFRAGVDDATDKPYDPERLVAIVKETIQSISPQNSYRVIEERGDM
jgi:DNA-binding response OmpR family regulator